jgi:hypothetical protein
VGLCPAAFSFGNPMKLNWQKMSDVKLETGTLCMLVVNDKILPDVFVWGKIKSVEGFIFHRGMAQGLVLPRDVQAILLKSDIPGPEWLKKSMNKRREVDNETARYSVQKSEAGSRAVPHHANQRSQVRR